MQKVVLNRVIPRPYSLYLIVSTKHSECLYQGMAVVDRAFLLPLGSARLGLYFRGVS